MTAPREDHRPRRRPFLAGAEAVLWLSSILLLGTVAWKLADATTFQMRARERLAAAFAPSEAAPAGAASRPGPSEPAPEGAPLGMLTIPRLELSVVVAEGDSEAVLQRAVGRLPWSARPGEPGNVVLAGHRDTFFAPLAGVRVGDAIVLETWAGEAFYRVDWTAVVEPSDVSVVAASDGPALTLVTCYPFRYLGSAPQRFVVRALRLETRPL